VVLDGWDEELRWEIIYGEVRDATARCHCFFQRYRQLLRRHD
jgi:hypothetical protein